MLYDYPQYYEIALSFRDIAVESAFIDSCIKHFSTIPVTSVFEVACGPAPHAGELVSRGYQYCGLDINRNMLDYAQYQWRHLKPPARFIQGNMANFTCDLTCDFAYVLLGSLYLNGPMDLANHFDCMARLLKPGGLYFLDWCVQFADPMQYAENNAYRIEKDGIRIDSAFKIRLIDQDSQMYEEVWTVDVNDHGRQRRFHMIERNKAIFPDEFQRLVGNRSDFTILGWFAEWNLDRPIVSGAEVPRPLVILQRR